MEFTKLHGLGNDFILVDAFHREIRDPGALAARLCDRHFGVGADGLILALPSASADARMGYYNSDGTAAEMCGNGIRCLGRFLYEKGLCRKSRMTVETGAGMLTLALDVEGGSVRSVTVDMGAPVFDPHAIPVAAETNEVTVLVEGRRLRFFCASMGNPHAVTFDLYPEDAAFRRLGPALVAHPLFPRGANIEFCRLNGEGGADVKVWERGDGPTLACGTGACAVLAAGASLGLLPREAPIRLPGGVLDIKWAGDGHLFMTGPAETVFEGRIAL